MRFGSLKLSEAAGAVLAHAVKAGDLRLPKGHVLTPADITALMLAGTDEVIVAQRDQGDLLEDDAAARVAAAIAPDHLRFSAAATGRVNIYSRVHGLFVATRETVDRLNRIDPAITLACLSDHVPVQPGDMVATIKIIPLAVAGSLVEQAETLLRSNSSAFEVKPFAATRCGPNSNGIAVTEAPGHGQDPCRARRAPAAIR